jgi:hypothetical protein
MANKEKVPEQPEGVLVAAAKSIGAAAGTIAAAVGITAQRQPKVRKLVNKNKSRLPRRQKKTAKTVATRAKRTARAKIAA